MKEVDQERGGSGKRWIRKEVDQERGGSGMVQVPLDKVMNKEMEENVGNLQVKSISSLA